MSDIDVVRLKYHKYTGSKANISLGPIMRSLEESWEKMKEMSLYNLYLQERRNLGSVLLNERFPLKECNLQWTILSTITGKANRAATNNNRGTMSKTQTPDEAFQDLISLADDKLDQMVVGMEDDHLITRDSALIPSFT